jgi:glycosyltransferase involved in cell wall biosynthesis
MKITIATGPLLPVPPVRGGAIPRIWHGMAGEFARRGHEVCIVARRYPGQPDHELAGSLRYVRSGGFSQSRWVTLDLFKGFFDSRCTARHLPVADILVTNDFWMPVFAGRWAGRIVVNANRFPKGQYFLYRRAARIAAASAAVRDAIALRVPALRDRIRIFPNPIDTGIMCPDGNGARSTAERVLLFVGRLHPEKGVHVLAEAFARIAVRHAGWRLRIVGPWREADGGGGEHYVRRLKALLGDAPGQIAAPQFDPAALAAEYRAAELFCYPSLAEDGESFGVAALEAMACGTPPVVSALECFRDFVNDGENGWVFDHRAPDTVGSLAAVLEGAMADPARSRAVGERGGMAARRFGYAEVAAAYLEDFAGILADGATNA